MRLLPLAATTRETEVETALSLLLDAGSLPTHEAVRELVQGQPTLAIPQLSPAQLDLSSYDRLLDPAVAHE